VRRRAKIRVALLGAGRWGTNYVAAIGRCPDLELLAVCDPDPHARAAIRTLSEGVIIARDVASILDGVDALVIATPNESHGRLALAGLRARKHVLVEKPLALTAAEALAVVDESRVTGMRVMVGHLSLHHPAVSWLLSISKSGRLGELLRFVSERCSTGAAHRPGSALWELGPHDVALALRLFGRPPDSVDVRRDGAETHVELIFGHARAQLLLSRNRTKASRQVMVVGTAGTAEIDELAFSARGTTSDDMPLAPPPLRATDLLDRQLADFAKRVHGGPAEGSTAEEGAEVVEVLTACERACSLTEQSLRNTSASP
jgi:predicted dehydrogenase